MSWYPFDDGKSIGGRGSEGGIILRDEEHADGARITLEQDGHTAPLSITCGIYGWMFHTLFLSTESEGLDTFEQMKTELAKIIGIIPLAADPDVDARSQLVCESISEFVEKFK